MNYEKIKNSYLMNASELYMRNRLKENKINQTNIKNNVKNNILNANLLRERQNLINESKKPIQKNYKDNLTRRIKLIQDSIVL